MAKDNILIELVQEIDLLRAYNALRTDECGGIDVFIGTVRNESKGRQVVKLVFEAYEPMALAEMQKIATAAYTGWPLSGVVMQHVTGEKKVGEPVVIVGASSAHREAAFEACRFLIDELKKTVPIWKKEFYEDGSVWVNAHP